MPQMFRPGGVRKQFKSIEDGEKAGFYASFNEMAKAQRKANPPTDACLRPAPPQDGEVAPESTEAPAPPGEPQDERPQPPVDEFDDMVVDSDYGDPAPPPAQRPLPDMELGEVKALAVKYGLDPSVHHMTLRKQVEECINAQERSD